MRIITGTLKGRRIDIPKTLDVRPTTDRTKESMFSVIEAHKYIDGARVLDLFAGSGNLGFEALSRGAESVLFVDSERSNLKNIEKTADEFGVGDRVRTHCATAEDFLGGMPTEYDFIFCDPPYDYPMMEELVGHILEDGWLSETGWFLLEHDKRHHFEEHPHCFFSRAYGRTIVAIFQKQPVSNDS